MFALGDGPRIALSLRVLGDGADVVEPVVPEVVEPVVPDVVAPVVPVALVPDVVPDVVCAPADKANPIAIALANAQRVNVFIR